MAEQNPNQSERGVARQTQEKFEFYLLSLVFTLLALSIQTAKFGIAVPADVLELVGWFLLLISGVAGLWRMEWIPIIRLKLAQKSEFVDEIFKLKEVQLQGQQEILVMKDGSRQPIPQRIENRENAVKILNPYIEKLERHSNIKYVLHRYGFLLGIISIACARAYVPTFALFEALKP